MARCVETDRVVCSDKTVVTVAMSYQMAMGSDQMESPDGVMGRQMPGQRTDF